MSIDRRTALKALGAGGAALAVRPLPVAARDPKVAPPDAKGMLYDATLCVGCQACVVACCDSHDMAPPPEGARYLPQDDLNPYTDTVIRSYADGEQQSFAKVQCMHCVDPACASACMLGAMQKREHGIGTWDGDLCVGCRYCQIACPFGVPAFEWDEALPSIVKCDMCVDRVIRDAEPACVEACPREAIIFGDYEAMIEEGHRRLEAEPERYEPKVYGERDLGGTQVLYLTKAGIPFDALGLPDQGPQSVPEGPESLQHTLYKGFIAPIVLFLALVGAVLRSRKKTPELVEEREHRSEAVGGQLLTTPARWLLAFFALGMVLLGWRFVAGLGAVTAMSDGYPFGLWIAFDVVTGTALACGGYAVAILVYVMNRGRYHPLVRSALVTSALGYTLGGLAVLFDIGRYWNFYKIPFFFGDWNLNSILLEVALCIMLYTLVLWIELSPAFLERWKESGRTGLRRFAERTLPPLQKAMPWMIALGLLLPTMHQSSLGSMMLLAGAKLHPLWNTQLLPGLFLISCIGMGYAVVVMESSLASTVFGRQRETNMLAALASPMAVTLFLYAGLRFLDVAWRMQLDAALAFDGASILFIVEMALFLIPAFMLIRRDRRRDLGYLFRVAMLVILAGGLYRFSTYLIAYDPGPGWSYFPAVPELLVTLGIIAFEILAYIVIVKRFPVLTGTPAAVH